jgi:hypothetical protein
MTHESAQAGIASERRYARTSSKEAEHAHIKDMQKGADVGQSAAGPRLGKGAAANLQIDRVHRTKHARGQQLLGARGSYSLHRTKDLQGSMKNKTKHLQRGKMDRVCTSCVQGMDNTKDLQGEDGTECSRTTNV